MCSNLSEEPAITEMPATSTVDDCCDSNAGPVTVMGQATEKCRKMGRGSLLGMVVVFLLVAAAFVVRAKFRSGAEQCPAAHESC